MIEFKCSQCGADMEAPQSLAGKTANCPKCGALRRVPSQARSAASANKGKHLLIGAVIIGVIAAAGVGGYLAVRLGLPKQEKPASLVTAPDQKVKQISIDETEVARLRAENAQLKGEITKPKAAQATAVPAQEQAGASGAAREIRKAIAEHRLTNGMTIGEAEEALGVEFRQIADSSSEGTICRANVSDKVRPNPNTGAIAAGTEYTITIRDGVISGWSSRRTFIDRNGLPHYRQ